MVRPSGLASVVFAILAVETLEGSMLADQAVGVVAFTVAASVVLHGSVIDEAGPQVRPGGNRRRGDR